MENEYLFSELDQYLFGHATHYDLYKKLGAHPINIDGVEGTYFAVWAPNAQRVSVIGEFNDWDTEANIIENKDDIDVSKITGTSDMKKIQDLKGNPLLLFVNSWSVGMVLERNEGLKLTEFGRN